MLQVGNLLKLIVITSALLILTAISSTAISAQSKDDGAKVTNQTQNAGNSDDLKDCAEMLDKSISELESCRDRSEKYLNELTETRSARATDQQQIVFYKDQVKRFEARIAYLEKIKCSTLSFFWVIKYKRCN